MINNSVRLQPVMSYNRFPHDHCNQYCKDFTDCIAANDTHVKCITNIIVNSLCYVMGVIDIILQERKIKNYELMLVNASKQIQNIALWIEKLQQYNSDFRVLNGEISEDRRICPRFSVANISAIINSREYPVKNISLSGCFIETRIPYPPGTTINMEMGINDGIPVTAVVRHCSETGIGVEFVEIDKDKEKEFLWYMADFFFKTSKT